MTRLPFAALARRFAAAEHGNVAMLGAIALLPMLLLVGGASEFYLALDVKAKMTNAADSAVLAATGREKMSLTTTDAGSLAIKTFKGQLDANQTAMLTSATPTVVDDDSGRNATLSFTASVPTMFMKLMGKPTIEIAGSTSATVPLPTYMDFYMLLDNTPSMGVAATTAGISTMVANTPDQCAFACHDMSATPNDYYGLSKKLGVPLRIDVVRTATQQLTDTATATQSVPNQFRMAVYTFGAKAEAAGLTNVAPLSSNLASVKAAANAVDLMTIPFQGYDNDQQTGFKSILTAMNSQISHPGSGASASVAPQKVLFFVSDGVSDYQNSSSCTKPTWAGFRCQEPIDVSKCTTIKNRGIKIAVLYTTYLPLPTNGWYNTYIAPFQSQIATQMQACASPGLYFEVSPSGGIAEAMSALFTKAVQMGRLTR